MTLAPAPTLPRKPLVLVVDDDLDLLAALAYSLGSDGYDARVCGDVDSALEAANEATPQCLVIDYRLGDMDGLALAKRLRQQGVEAPLILITSHPDRKCRLAAEQMRAVIVEKPLLNDVLNRRIGALLTQP
ncbi:MAG TPA: response regulator [Caulobacteraceae bacterium]|nr:response regulator [Caulobacteraceae bacterium]